jgi:DNA-directed RNA polymerase specialized sigma subunit
MKCYKYYQDSRKQCDKKNCRYWINSKKDKNCCVIASNSNKTLQEIGEMYGITRMRVCQIEKKIVMKIKKRVNDLLSSKFIINNKDSIY